MKIFTFSVDDSGQVAVAGNIQILEAVQILQQITIAIKVQEGLDAKAAENKSKESGTLQEVTQKEVTSGKQDNDAVSSVPQNGPQ